MARSFPVLRRLAPEFLVALLLPVAAARATVSVASSPDRTVFAPVVAALPDGGWVVAWDVIAPGSLGQVRLRVLDASGEPRGPEQVVDTGILALAIRTPRLAVAPDGEILVAYRLQRYNYLALAVRRFDSRGEPLATGPTPAVVWGGPTEVGRHDVAPLAGGEWLLTWAFSPFDGSAPPSIRAQRLDAALLPVGAPFALSPDDGAGRVDPALSRRTDGLFAAWARGPASGKGSSLPIAAGRRLDGRGEPIEGEVPLRLEDGTAQSDLLPAVESAGGSEGRAVWFAREETTHAVTLRTRRLLEGSPVGNQLELRSLATWVEPSLPGLAADARGRFVVSWIEPIPGDPAGRYQPGWQAFGRGGTPLGAMHPLPAIAGQGSASPGVAMQPDGAWAVAWGGESTTGQSAILADLGALADGCEAEETALCLAGGRFRVEATRRTHAGLPGFGHAMPMTGETGAFWFFAPGNVELVVKVLDACALPEFHDYWVFASGLTDVEVDLAVTDTATGERWSYHNPRGVPFPPVQDTEALRVCP